MRRGRGRGRNASEAGRTGRAGLPGEQEPHLAGSPRISFAMMFFWISFEPP
jgi:hypothetical protein